MEGRPCRSKANERTTRCSFHFGSRLPNYPPVSFCIYRNVPCPLCLQAFSLSLPSTISSNPLLLFLVEIYILIGFARNLNGSLFFTTFKWQSMFLSSLSPSISYPLDHSYPCLSFFCISSPLFSISVSCSLKSRSEMMNRAEPLGSYPFCIQSVSSLYTVLFFATSIPDIWLSRYFLQ